MMAYLDHLDVDQAGELKSALRRAGWDNQLVKRLCESEVLVDTLNILRGDAEAAPIEHTLDLSANPVFDNPENTVVKHVRHSKTLLRRLCVALVDPHDCQYLDHTRCYHRVYAHWKAPELHYQTRLDRRHMRPRFLKGQRPGNMVE